MLPLSHQQAAFDLLLDPLWQAAQGLRNLVRWFRRGLKRDVRRLARKQQPAPYEHDLLAWGQHFLPHHFQSPPSAMHREVAALLDEASRERQRPEEVQNDLAASNIITPRAHAGGSPGNPSETNAPRKLTRSPLHLFTRSAPLPHGRGSETIPHSTFPTPHSPLKLNLLAPRASAKSTLVTLSYVLREALTGRQPYIWIVSDTKHQAMSHLDNLYAELQDNPELLKSHCRARGWIKTGNRLALSDVLIEAFGTGQRLRGQRFRQHRPTLVVCDDLQNDGHMQSATQRDRSRSWFHGMLLKAGTKRTSIINLGTALHREAIAMELHATPGWTSRRFQAIEQWPTNMHLWAEWEALYRQGSGVRGQESGVGENPAPIPASRKRQRPEEPHESAAPCSALTPRAHAGGSPDDATETNVHPNLTRSPLHLFTRSSPQSAARDFYNERREAMEAGAALLWPQEEDLYTLMCMRAESGPAAFEREKQCVPLNPEECEWPEAYFGDDIWFSHWPQDLRLKTLALDPSKGTDAKHGDYSAFVMLGIANDGTLYVEANLARRPTPQIVTDGVELIKYFQPQAFGIETNQFQALLGADFEAELKKQRLFGSLPYTINNHLAKPVRIRRLGPLLANRNLKFKSNSPGTTMLVEQLREFPLAKHDDGPDALEMALQLAETIAKPIPNDGLGNRLI